MRSVEKRLVALVVLGLIPLAALPAAFVRPARATGPAAPAPQMVTATTSIYLPLIAKPSRADLSISKTDGLTNTLTGSVLTYTIVVANHGPDDMAGAVVTDVFPSTITGVNWACGADSGAACGSLSGSGDISVTVDLPISGTATFTASGTFGGAAVNTAYVTAPPGAVETNPGNNSAADATRPQTDLSLTLTDGQDVVEAGSHITYTLIITNYGPENVMGAVVTDVFPSNLSDVTWTCSGAGGANCGVSSGSGNINVTLPTMIAGSTVTFKASGTLNGDTTNTAYVTLPAGIDDRDLSNNSATDITLLPRADLSISKTDGLTNALTGSVITYTIVAANHGPDDVTGAVVTDEFPSTITGVNWTCTAASGAVCGSPSGSGNINATITLSANSSVTFTAAGTFNDTTVNMAQVAAPPGVIDSDLNNNSASDATTVPPISPPPPSAGWLAYVNYYRAVAHLPPVTENPAWSDGAYMHACYMVKNDYFGHDEPGGSSAPCFSPEGVQAAGNSNLMLTTDINYTDFQAIDLWMRGPFHGIGLLDPQLLQVGFGSFREAATGPGPVDWQMGAVLDILRGLTTSVPANVSFPVMWPGAEATSYIRAYTGFEFPNPLTSRGCEAYQSQPSTGMPIYLQVGAGNLTPVVTYTLITNRSGSPLEHCWFDESTYTHPDSSQQSVARSVLGARDAIILIPRYPLDLGERYTVTVTVSGQTYTWSFDVSNSAMFLPREPEALVVVR